MKNLSKNLLPNSRFLVSIKKANYVSKINKYFKFDQDDININKNIAKTLQLFRILVRMNH